MRLDKLLANMGFGSRKMVKSLVKEKRVTINKNIVRDSSIHVDIEQDIVLVDGKQVHYQKYVYIMMNKAPGYVSATEDRQEKTVIDLLPSEYQQFEPFPVGRLDKDTEGLLLLTNDGKLGHILTSPRNEIEKTYFAKIDGVVTNVDKEALHHGVRLEDGYMTKPASLQILKSDSISEIELTITEGKYHQVKRMFASLGKKVIYLQRIRMGELLLDKSLTLGAFRELKEEELTYCLSLKKEGDPSGPIN